MPAGLTDITWFHAHRLIAKSLCQGDVQALEMNARTRISSGHFIVAGTFSTIVEPLSR
jgi:hypothetical protein